MRTVAEVAERLNVSTKTVTRWIEEGKISAFRFGKSYRIEEKVLEQFIENSRVNPEE